MAMQISETYVVSLHDDIERRRHVVDHFHSIGLRHFGFWPAVAHDDPAVEAIYRRGGVAAWPPCFRCGQTTCDCVNNILMPRQVANFLSFLGIWSSIPDDPEHLVMVCEDDVAFHTNAMENLADFLEGFERLRPRLLIRLAQSGQEPFRTLPRALPGTNGRSVMSNAAYLINGAFARHLARCFDDIRHTSDVWLHRVMAKDEQVQAITLDPLLATDLSYNREHARFASRIHPRGMDEADVARMATHRKRVTTAKEYLELLESWKGSKRG